MIQQELNLSSALQYSFEEQWTGRRWVDGKKIYTKTVDCGLVVSNGEARVDSGIDGLDSMIEMHCNAQCPSEKLWCEFPVNTTTYRAQNLSVFLQFDGTIVVNAQKDIQGDFHYFMTIYYTCTDR